MFKDWTFFTFVREPRSRLLSGIFEVALRVYNAETKKDTPNARRSASSLYVNP